MPADQATLPGAWSFGQSDERPFHFDQDLVRVVPRNQMPLDAASDRVRLGQIPRSELCRLDQHRPIPRRTDPARSVHVGRAPLEHLKSTMDEQRSAANPRFRRSGAIRSCTPEGLRTPNLLIRRARDQMFSVPACEGFPLRGNESRRAVYCLWRLSLHDRPDCVSNR
jgi:hypothetical protein